MPNLIPTVRSAILASLAGMALIIFVCVALNHSLQAHTFTKDQGLGPRIPALDGLRTIVEVYVLLGYFDVPNSLT
jgi:hypothetical protein